MESEDFIKAISVIKCQCMGSFQLMSSGPRLFFIVYSFQVVLRAEHVLVLCCCTSLPMPLLSLRLGHSW